MSALKSALLRQAIEQAKKQGDHRKAAYLLDQLWREDPTAGVANYIAAQAAILRDSLSLMPYKVAFLRSFTVEPVIPFLKTQAFLFRIDLDTYVGDFNTYAQDMLDPSSSLYQFAPHTAILAVQTRDVLPQIWGRYVDLDAEEATRLVESTRANLTHWIETFRRYSRANLIVHTFEAPTYSATGVLETQRGGQLDAIRQLNEALRETARRVPGVYLLDYDHLISRHGRLNWFDEQKWLLARLPMRADALLYLANEYLRFLLPLSGRIAKALVTDLDNTLWGGVIGEDGLEGIKIGTEYPGAAYQALQRAMLDLSGRGILLAVCSKNNAADALEALEKQPGMLLHPEHFAALRINWDDKVTNMRHIAAELNIGVDAIALFDDNPAEREQVRQELPEVLVIEVPSDPMDYARVLREFPAFERLTLTEEDRQRSTMYAEQQQRTRLQQAAGTLEEYYRSLQMVITVQPLAHSNLERIAQLTQKTNQFNLTTRRYSEQQLLDMISNGGAEVYGASVRDRFGDNGLVGVMIARRVADACEIDTFLLSCRVIGRTIETGLLAHLIERARICGVRRVIGWFIPTKKNVPAKGFLPHHGFELIREETGGAQQWMLDLQVHSVTVPEWLTLQTLNPPTHREEDVA